MLNRDPEQRLGSSGPTEIKQHQIFNQIQWSKLLAKKYIPPFKPAVTFATDTSNFDQEFTNEPPLDSLPADSALSSTVQQQFDGFSYISHEMGSMVGSMLAEKVKGMNVNSPGLDVKKNAVENNTYQKRNVLSAGFRK